MLKGALLGAGNVARNGHLPGWLARSDVTLVAASDPLPESRDALRLLAPAIRIHEDAEALLDAEALDFVDICAPPAAHARLAHAALARSLHVLCEKPLVLEAAELQGLVAHAAARDRVLACVHNWKHAPPLARVLEEVRRGAVGRVTRVTWETRRTKPAVTAGDGGNWRLDPALAGGGVLFDHGWHALYVVHALLPHAPERVAATLETRRHHVGTLEDTASLRLEAHAFTATVFLTWAADDRRNTLVVEGEEATLRLDGDSLDWQPHAGPPERTRFPKSLVEGSHHADWFWGVIEEFLAEIADPGARGRSLAEAEACLRTLRRSQESHAQGGKPVDLAR